MVQKREAKHTVRICCLSESILTPPFSVDSALPYNVGQQYKSEPPQGFLNGFETPEIAVTVISLYFKVIESIVLQACQSERQSITSEL